MTSAETSLEPKLELVQGTNADQVAQRIRQELARFNEMKTGDRHWSPLVLSLTDANAQIIGGLVGELFWNALHVELLWVADAHPSRHRGRGTRGAAAVASAAPRRHRLGRHRDPQPRADRSDNPRRGARARHRGPAASDRRRRAHAARGLRAPGHLP